MNADSVERLLVVRDVAVGMGQRPCEAFCLQRHDLIARGALGVVHLGAVTTSSCVAFRHGPGAFPLSSHFCLLAASAGGSHVPPIAREWPRNSAITRSPLVTRTS